MPTIYSGKDIKTHDKHQETGRSVVHPVSPLTSFMVNPTGIKFETQQDDEHVVIFLRQHLIVNLGWIILVILMVLAPILIFPLLFASFQIPFQIPMGYFIVGTLFWYVATFGFAIASFIRWFFNIYIVTNERIVDVDFLHLLYKELSETRLVNVQDVTYKTGGIFETFLNYGHVYIQTAGTEPNFEFLSVPNPEIVVQTISEHTEKEKLRFR